MPLVDFWTSLKFLNTNLYYLEMKEKKTLGHCFRIIWVLNSLRGALAIYNQQLNQKLKHIHTMLAIKS